MTRKETDALGNVTYLNVQDDFHRTDGPAITLSNGKSQFFIHGERLTEEEFSTARKIKVL